jgi:hypothetical protein
MAENTSNNEMGIILPNTIHHVTCGVVAWIATTPSSRGVIVGGLCRLKVGRSASVALYPKFTTTRDARDFIGVYIFYLGTQKVYI